MRVRRYLLAGLGVAALALIAAAGSVVWLLTTESGARFALARAESLAAGALGVEAINGRIIDRLELTGVRLRGEGFTAEVDRLELGFDLSGLLGGALTVDYLGTSVIRVVVAAADETAPNPPEAADPGPGLPALPIAIRLTRASIEGIRIERADDVVETERLTLSAEFSEALAEVLRFETRLNGFYLSLQGQFDWSAELALDAVVSWSGELFGEQWVGRAHFAGSPASMAVEQELLAPFALEAAGTLGVVPALAVDLRVEWRDLTVPGFEGLVSSEGSAEIAGGIDAFRVAIVSDLGALTAAGGIDLESLGFEAVVTAEGVAPGRLVAGWPGVYGARGALRGRFGPDYSIATDGLAAEAVIGADTISADFAGSFAAPGVVTAERLELNLGANRVLVSGSAGGELDFAVAADLAELDAIARLVEAPEIADVVSVDPRFLVLRGDAMADLTVTGAWDAPAIGGELSLTSARYLDLPLALSARFERAPGAPVRYTIETLEASLGASRLVASGTIGDPLAFSLEATLDDLTEIAALAERDEIRALWSFDGELADVSGRATLSLTLAGSAERPEISADVNLIDLSNDRWSLDRALVGLEFDTAPGGRADVVIEADAEDVSLRLAAAGRYADDRWSGRIESLTIAEDVLGGWMLDAPVALELGPGFVDLGSGCLGNAGTSVCIEGRYGTESDGIDLRAEDFDLATLAPLLPPTLSLAGRVSVDAALNGLATDAPRGTLAARGGPAEIGIDLDGSEPATITLDAFALDAELDAYALSVEAELDGPATGRVELAMSSADVRDEDAPINGSLDVFWPDVGVAALLSPDLGAVGGTLEVALNVAGTTRNPAVDGSAVWNEGSVSVPQWGVVVDRIYAEALSRDGRSLEFTGSGYVEDGELRLSGTTELDPARSWPTRLSLTGEAIPVARRPDATIIASPDLDIVVALPRIDVSGVVVVPRADISIAELPERAVRISPDAVVHGLQETTELPRPLQVTATIDVELGDEVHYEASNLRADLSGDLQLVYQSGRSPNATGNVSLDGTYEAFGQVLDLERGELRFAGPLDDPGLDVRAVRSIGSVTVGLRLGGSLRAPQSSVFSDPAMSDANALSYLLTGRPFEASDEEQNTALESMALTLGLQQALPVVARVGDTLGLDELSIAASEVDASALMAGKYLSPKVYMSYTYGLFNRLGGFLLRYEINERFSLETRSGNEKSMDLLYSVEKD
jgi:translocation and assembly module TamB